MYDTKKFKPAVKKYMDISTAHIPYSDNILLSQVKETAEEFIVNSLHYGFCIYINSDELNKNMDEYIDTIRSMGLSEALCNIIRAAYELQCEFLILDGSAQILKDLPTFDW